MYFADNIACRVWCGTLHIIIKGGCECLRFRCLTEYLYLSKKEVMGGVWKLLNENLHTL